MTAIEVEQWYHKWMADHDRAEVATVNVLDMLKDFAQQYAKQSLPSVVRTFEQILEEDYHVQLEDNRWDESIKLAAEKYASQYAHQQPVQAQLCPKCFGEGQLSDNISTSSIYRICPVCNGNKVLYLPNQQPVNDGWTKQDIINAWNSAYGGDAFLSGEDYVESLILHQIMIEEKKDDKHSESGNDTKPIVTGSGSSSKVVMAQCDDCGRDIMDD